MKEKELLKTLKENQEKEERFFIEQCEKNSNNPHFNLESIESLITEIFIRLTGKDLEGKRYIDYMEFDVICKNIENLERLYSLREKEVCLVKEKNKIEELTIWKAQLEREQMLAKIDKGFKENSNIFERAWFKILEVMWNGSGASRKD